MQEVEIIDKQKVPESFQSYLGNLKIKTNLPKHLFQKWRESLPNDLTSSQTIYLANLDSATDRVASQSSEKIDFYNDHRESDTKMFAYINFLCDNIPLNMVIIVSPVTAVAVISLWQSFTKLILSDAIWFKTGTRDHERYIPTHELASGLPLCCLLLARHGISQCDSLSIFSYIGMKTFQTLKNKINKLTNMIDFDEFLSLSLESPSVSTWIQYVFYLCEENKSSSSVNKLRYRMFVKNNLSEDCIPSTSEALVLHHIFSQIFLFIYQK